MSSYLSNSSHSAATPTYVVNMNIKLEECLELLQTQQQMINKQQLSMNTINIMLKTLVVQVAHLSSQQLNNKLGSNGELSAPKRSFGSSKGEPISAIKQTIPMALLRPLPPSTIALLPHRKVDSGKKFAKEAEEEEESPPLKRAKFDPTASKSGPEDKKVTKEKFQHKCIGRKDLNLTRKRCLLCVHYYRTGSDQAPRSTMYCEGCSIEFGTKIYLCNSTRCWENHHNKIVNGPIRVLRRIEKLQQSSPFQLSPSVPVDATPHSNLDKSTVISTKIVYSTPSFPPTNHASTRNEIHQDSDFEDDVDEEESPVQMPISGQGLQIQTNTADFSGSDHSIHSDDDEKEKDTGEVVGQAQELPTPLETLRQMDHRKFETTDNILECHQSMIY